MEKEIRDQVEKRLREERDNLLSDFQAKISLVQVIFYILFINSHYFIKGVCSILFLVSTSIFLYYVSQVKFHPK